MIVPLDRPEDTRFIFVSVDRSSGTVLGQGEFKLSAVAIAREEGIERTPFSDVAFGMDVLVDQDASGYRMMVMHPRLTESTFTKLFFMDGKYMDHFEKFSDRQSFSGGRIIVWKVDWKEFE